MTMSTCRRSCAADRGSHRPSAITDTGTVTYRVRRVITTRAGGVSAPPFNSFNLGDHVGDRPAAVAANRNRLAAAVGLDSDHMIWMKQVHGEAVTQVDGPRDEPVDATDGLITTTPGLALAVLTADCVPVLLSDARAGVVSGVHAGRVGAQRGVVERSVAAMIAAGAHAEHISAFLGPAISGPNYEVPEEMAAEVEAALPGSRTTSRTGTAALDLRAGIVRQLLGLGVEAIDVDPRCTFDDPTLFSHRRSAKTGRLASVVWLE